MSAWIATYLTAGVIWCLWNSSSRLFRAVSERMYEDGNFAWLALAFALGTLIWPIGLAGNIVMWAIGEIRTGRRER